MTEHKHFREGKSIHLISSFRGKHLP